MKKHSSFSNHKESSGTETKSMRWESRKVMSELVVELSKQLEAGTVVVPGKDKNAPDAEQPNLDRLTVGVDLGDQRSNYCILGLRGETLAEGQFRTSPQSISEFFGVLWSSLRIAGGDGSGNAFGVGAGADRRNRT